MGFLRLGERRVTTPAVCGSVLERTVEGMVRARRRAEEGGAGVVELRLDGLEERPRWRRLLGGRLPVILTYRPEREGGLFRGGEEERVERLEEGMEEGAPCVDLELSTPPGLRRRILAGARRRGVTVILSHHELSGVPPLRRLAGLVRRMAGEGEVVKVVAAARSAEEAVRMLELYRTRPPFPLISFAMGEQGTFTRILSALLGSPLVYASVGRPTAPGQLDVRTTSKLLEMVR